MDATEFITVGSVLVAVASTVAALVATQRSNARIASYERTEEKLRKEREERHTQIHDEVEKRNLDMNRQLVHTDRNLTQAITLLVARQDFQDQAIMEMLSVGGEVNEDFLSKFVRRRPDLATVYVQRQGKPFQEALREQGE